jgi:hypothetical protein
MPIFHLKGKKSEEVITTEFAKYWEPSDKCTFITYPSMAKHSADILLTCDTGNIAIEIKTYPPNLSAVLQVSGFAEEYEKKYNKKTSPVIVYSGGKAHDYVKSFADENKVKLYSIKRIKTTAEEINSDFNL